MAPLTAEDEHRHMGVAHLAHILTVLEYVRMIVVNALVVMAQPLRDSTYISTAITLHDLTSTLPTPYVVVLWAFAVLPWGGADVAKLRFASATTFTSVFGKYGTELLYTRHVIAAAIQFDDTMAAWALLPALALGELPRFFQGCVCSTIIAMPGTLA